MHLLWPRASSHTAIQTISILLFKSRVKNNVNEDDHSFVSVPYSTRFSTLGFVNRASKFPWKQCEMMASVQAQCMLGYKEKGETAEDV